MSIIKKIKRHYRCGTLWETGARKAKSFLPMPNAFRKATGMINHGIKTVNCDVFHSPEQNLKILIIKIDHMGDFLLAIPAIMRLREKFEYADIDIVVGEWNVSLAKKLNIFRNIYSFSFFKSKSFEYPQDDQPEKNELLKKLGEYDIVIDLRRQRDTRFLLANIQAGLKVGYRSFSEFDKELDICLGTELDQVGVIKNHNKVNISLQMLRLIDAIPSGKLSLPKLSECHPVKGEIAIFPAAGNPIKEWPVVNFVELSKRLLDTKIADKINVYLSDSERKIADYFSAIPEVSVLIGLDLDSLIESLSNCSLSIANNSFGSHLSSYLGIPLVAVYGGHETVKEWQPPFRRSTVIYSDVSCSPCHAPDIGSCPYDLICLKQITPEHVVDVIKEQLKHYTAEKNGIVEKHGGLNMISLEMKLPFTKKIFIISGNEKDESVIRDLKVLNGFYEPDVMLLLNQKIKPEFICLDIGANIGTISLVLSYLANKGKVYSFEALKPNFNFLKLNMEQNNIHNVEIFNNGIYNQNCELEFQYVDEFAGGGFTTTVGASDHRSVYEKVKCFKLDDWVKANNIQKIDFIKVDVEGAETMVLEGAEHVFNTMKPDLLVEFNLYTMKTFFEISGEDFYRKLKLLYPYLYLVDRNTGSLIFVNNYDFLNEKSKEHGGVENLYCSYQKQ